MCALGGFVRYYTNRNPVSEYRDELRVRDEMENTPQWKEFHRMLEDFMADQSERGLTMWSMKSIKANIKTAIKRLFVVCGPLYPDEVTKHHFREVRRNCPDLKDKTIKVYLCKLGLMIKFERATTHSTKRICFGERAKSKGPGFSRTNGRAWSESRIPPRR